MRRSQIVVVGSLNVDHVFSVERLPEPGETLLGKEYSIEFGGKGANQAVAAARLGAAVSFLGCIGRDTSGDAALAALAEEGIDISGVARLDETATGAAGIYVDGAGRNSIVVAPGANAAVNPVRIAAWESIIAAADCLLLQLEVPLPAVQAAVAAAQRHRVISLLDPAPAVGPLPADVIESVAAITPNETEVAALHGSEASLANGETMATKLVANGCARVIVTLGADGCLMAETNAPVQRFAAPPATVRNTVAAGDCFNGALGVALIEGKSWVDAIGFAQRAAAISVGRDGAQRAMPTRAEVE